jgi:hypothetical protein
LKEHERTVRIPETENENPGSGAGSPSDELLLRRSCLFQESSFQCHMHGHQCGAKATTMRSLVSHH